VQQGGAAPLGRATAAAPPIAASAQRLSIAPAALRIQRAPATSVVADGTPSHALTACQWGWTDDESVTETVAAVKDGATWKADPTQLVGHYSMQTRLLPAENEVTGPAGNSTAATFCPQVGELSRLGDCPGAWYMRSAVVAHERVHESHMAPALSSVAPAIQTDFNAVTVPDAAGKNAAGALTELKALPVYARAKGKMKDHWHTKYRSFIPADHAGPAAAAEHAVVDPMINTICTAAKTNSWPACATCPP
jgi:hypothetical protein